MRAGGLVRTTHRADAHRMDGGAHRGAHRMNPAHRRTGVHALGAVAPSAVQRHDVLHHHTGLLHLLIAQRLQRRDEVRRCVGEDLADEVRDGARSSAPRPWGRGCLTP
ncbi:hypothetical protein Slala05_83300 [Streptomyces lavendulae subsp. lavendulae]|nr:hypothetical protein Slala05_83300 [Streptomyces lavendulae subsp. lavendulae]